MAQSQQLTIEQALSRAKKATSQGKTADAVELYTAILQHQPNHPVAKKALRKLQKGLPQNQSSEEEASNPPQDQMTALVNFSHEGQTVELEQTCRELLRQYPQSVIVMNVLGGTLAKQGQLKESIQVFDKAIQLKPDFAEAYSNRGAVLQELGRLEDAVASCDKAIQLSPDLAEAYNNRGNALKGLGRLDEAMQSYDKAIQLKPEYINVYKNRGATLLELGRLDEAVQSYDQAIQLKPDFAEAYSDRGNALEGLGRLDEAVQSYDQAIQLKPDYVEAYSNRGAILRELGRLEDAVASYDKAIQLSPDLAEAYSNRGNALKGLGQLDEAIKSYDKAIEVRSDFTEAYNNRGVAFEQLGQRSEAAQNYDKAIQLSPDLAEGYNNRGNTLGDLGRLDEAMQNYDKAIQLKPDYVNAYSNLLMTLNYIPNQNAIDPIAMARKFGEIVTEKAKTHFSAYQCSPMPEKLRVGFVSGDLRNHPVGYFLENVLSSIDSSKIELIAYPTTPKVDVLSDRIKPFFSMWKPIYGQTDEVVANLIYADGVHVLVDLSGHTADNRLPMFGCKPSPVQVSWLGYFATTGLNEIDYFIGDPYVTPPQNDDQFTEKVWRLPETRWCFTPPDVDVEVSAPPALKQGYVTFGCFNNITKVNDKVVELWAKVLDAIPDSRLLLKAKQLPEQLVRESIIQRFAALGINSKRIILEEPEGRQKYFAAYNRIDITLDPFPFSGGTTSVESLWMGVPLITLAGDSLVSRQGVGVLTNAGLPDWIADDEESYLAKAIIFASDVDKLARLRANLRSQILASPLFDAPRFARNFEHALLEMWNQYANQELPPDRSAQAQTTQPSQDQITALVNLYNSGQLTKTEQACRDLLQIYPQSLVIMNVLGAALRGQGKLQEAVESFDRAIQLKPDFAEAYSNRGNALKDLGQLEEAVASCDKAIQLKPDYVEAYSNRGAILRELGRLEDAVASYDKAIQLSPDLAEAYSNRGNALKGLGQLDEAIKSYGKAIQLKPDFAEAYSNRGAVLQKLGRLQEAVQNYGRATQLKPDFAEAYSNRGVVLQDLGQLDEALQNYDKAIQLKPDYAEAYYNRGNALKDLGRLDEAMQNYAKAIQRKPDYAEAYNNRGIALRQLGLLDEALKNYNKAIQLKPDNAEAYYNRSTVLQELGRLQEAVASHDKAIQLKPDYAEAYINHGITLKDLGQLEEAMQNYDKAIQLKPDYVKAYGNLLMTLNYIPNQNAIDPIAMARKFGEIVTEKAKTHFSAYQCSPMPEKLRVGFVSGDLRNHPVGYFLENVLSSIDSSKIELIAYPTTPKVDVLSDRIKPFFSMWKPIYGQTDEVVANLIYADGVHVLVDLSGHTADNRLPMFGCKPSPVQVSWLGYFATTGLNEIDYFIGDPYVTPPQNDDQFTEKVWRLPETRWCFTPPDVDVEVSAPPALKQGYVTFGCFNNITKVNDKVVELWAKVLDAIPDSRLLLKAKQLPEQLVRESIIQRFAALGINSKRIILEEPEGRQKYFAAYNRIDITLDPFPFSGGTTSVESLWMGVPLITLAGDSLVSRQGVGVLTNAGLPDWIADDEESYLAKAIIFASDVDKLARLRANLRSQILASPLFDAPRFARNFEHALLEMWNQYANQELPPDRSAQAQTTQPSQDQITALVNLYNSGQLTKTEQACRDLLQIYPQSLVVMNVLGAALRGQGKLQEAVESFDRAIQLKPDFAAAYSNRGNALKDLGQLEEAVASCDKAIQLKPDLADAYSNRGNALIDLDRLDEAVTSCDKAIQLKPDLAQAHFNRGVVLQELGRFQLAMTSYQKAVSINPHNGLFWTGYASSLQRVKFGSYNDELGHYLLQVLDQPTVRPVDVSGAVITALHHHPVISHALELSKSDHFDEDIDHLTEQLSTVPLLLRIMELSSIADLEIEKMLTKMRKAMLHKAARGGGEALGLPFSAALAMHCFTNEYVFFESEEEKEKIELLQENVKVILENEGTVSPAWIAVLGAYRPLYTFSWANALLKTEWSDEIKKVIVRQVDNVREEQTLRSKIPRLSSIDDKVSQLVRNQYEENPYPRWINTGLSDKPKTISQVLKSVKLHLNFEAQQFSNKPDILVAGCGTGQHALGTASHFLNCNVLAMDLSLTSLSYAIRKTQELGITNIEYMQGDILKLDQLEREFDIVESAGVLHHMDDPLAGWKVLVRKLRAGGVMNIGLYSEIARQSIANARREIAKKEYTSSPDDIRRYREELTNKLLNTDSKTSKFIGWGNFYSLSECRDLLFHVQEHRFTLPQIEEALNDLGLKFLGFELKESWVRNEFRKLYPEEALVSLPLWHQFELKNPDTFRGMYQFWVQKV